MGYRQIELTAVPDRAANTDSARALRERARDLEAQLLEIATASGDPGAAAPPDDISTMRESLREGETLLEYYEARGTLYVFLLSRSGVEAVRLGSFIPVRQLLKLVRFHLGKFGWRPEPPSGLDAISDHFRELYRLLIAPLEDRLAPCRHLIVAPHRTLHGLPFAALHDGRQALVDRFTLSTAPSAQVLARCRGRKRKPGEVDCDSATTDFFESKISTVD